MEQAKLTYVLHTYTYNFHSQHSHLLNHQNFALEIEESLGAADFVEEIEELLQWKLQIVVKVNLNFKTAIVAANLNNRLSVTSDCDCILAMLLGSKMVSEGGHVTRRRRKILLLQRSFSELITVLPLILKWYKQNC